MSRLEFFNRSLFQWLFIRLTRCERNVIDGFDITEVSQLLNGYGIGGNVTSSRIESWYSIQYWVVPLTGWSSDFRYLSKGPGFKRISKIRVKRFSHTKISGTKAGNRIIE